MAMLKFRPLDAEDVEVRVSQVGQNAVQLLLYKTARTDMALLDETIGPENWQCDYKLVDEKLFCGIGIRFKDGEWVWKWDVGTPSNMESDKGHASDAFKRAGFKWGIGRELYSAPEIWVKRDQCTSIKKGRNGREQCYDKFVVTDMAVSDGRIVALQVCNMSNRGAVVYGFKSEKKPNRFAKLSDLKAEAIALGISEDGIKSWMQENVLKGKPLKDATAKELSLIEQHVATLIADKKALSGNG